jgi:hypothetical protein
MASPSVFGLDPSTHPRAAKLVQPPKPPLGPLPPPVAALDPRYTAHLVDWTPWPDAMTTAGPGDVGFGPVIQGTFSPGGGKESTTEVHRSVGINPAQGDALTTRWPDNAAAQAEFSAALYGTDGVALDLVFMRAHALARWDLLPGWYAKTWLHRGTVRSFAAPAAPKLPKVLETWTTAGQLTGLVLTGFDASGAPLLGTAKVTGSAFLGFTVAGAVTPWAEAWNPDPTKALRYLDTLTPPTTAAQGDGFDTIASASPSNQSTTATWAWFWSKGAKSTPPPHPGWSGGWFGLHNWDRVWKLQVNSVDGAKWVPKETWAGPFPGKLVALALEADTLRDSDAWQEKASTWWKAYLEHCPQFGMPHTAGHLPPLYQRPTVTYRPHWWIVDADWLRARVDIPQPEIFAVGKYWKVPDWQAKAFQAAIEEWISDGAKVVDPYAFWGHQQCENWAEGPDFVDILGLLFAFAVVGTIAPALASSLVGAFGIAGTTLGSALADLGAAGLGSGLNAEATGGTFGDGFGDAFEDPIELAVDLGGGFVEDLAGLAEGTIEEVVDQIEAAIEDPLTLLDGFGGDFVEDALDLGEGTLETVGDLLAGEVPEIPMGWFDDILPDSFEEGLDFAEDALDLYETVEDIFGGDDGFGGTAGGIAGGAGDLLDLLGGGIGGGGGGIGAGGGGGGGLPADTGLGLTPAKPSSTLTDLAPVLAIGLLALVVVRS